MRVEVYYVIRYIFSSKNGGQKREECHHRIPSHIKNKTGARNYFVAFKAEKQSSLKRLTSPALIEEYSNFSLVEVEVKTREVAVV